MRRRIVRALPLAAAAAGGATLAALALTAAYRWAEPRLADWAADRAGGGR